MPVSFNSGLHLISFILTLAAASALIFIRLRASSRPINAAKIVAPPLGMSTGFMMFVYPPTHIPLLWAAIAFAVGVVFFSYPLILTTKLQVEQRAVYARRSKAFIFILLALLVLRVAAHGYIEEFITIYQTAAVFFILAFGMIVPWRIYMFVQYRKLIRSIG
ncbi:CcdC family protein [Paenibacillus chartarius]|uniref:CcdC family protein n=1 Tax=Paenibacillus chartarius TaxID=747481 RepID=A0ABV6DKI5_9BACL